jgi:transcription elongation factor GreA
MEEEIRQLEKELRYELPREIQKAVAMGDLRENAEYQSALERQGFVRARLGHLRKMVSELSAVDVANLPRDRASLGSKVSLVDLDSGAKVFYELVLSEEADFPNGKVSVNSPIGKGLLGKGVGEEVIVRAPAGDKSYEVEKLLTIHDRQDEL